MQQVIRRVNMSEQYEHYQVQQGRIQSLSDGMYEVRSIQVILQHVHVEIQH